MAVKADTDLRKLDEQDHDDSDLVPKTLLGAIIIHNIGENYLE